MRSPNAWVIAAYCSITAACTFAADAFGLPDQVLLVFLPPVLMAALLRPRYVYVSMHAFFFGCAVSITENYGRLPFSDSTLTVTGIFVITAVACEAVRTVSQRQTLLSQRVADSEQRLRAYVDNAPDSIFVLDNCGGIVEVNEAACKTFDYDRSELIGNTFDTLCVDDSPFTGDGYRRRQWSGRLRRGDGIEFAAEMSIGQFTSKDVVSFVAIVRDVEKRTRAEAKFRKSEAIRKSILESAPDYVMLLDLDYRIVFINQTLPDHTPDAVLGDTVLSFLSPSELVNLQACFERVRETQAIETIESSYTLLGTDDVLYFDCRIAPVLESGEVAAFILSASDVTERRKQEAERVEFERSLLQSQKRESLGLLAGGVAHDFNNLLVAIMGRADLARDHINNPGLIEEHLQQILEASQHAAGLCRQLLAYSGKGRFVIAPTDLSELIKESRKLLEFSAPDSVHIEYALNDLTHTVEADATQLRQVVMNLVTNASEAMQPQGGNVTIRTGIQELDHAERLKHINGENLEDGLYAYLEVEDTGSGMTTQTMERMFDPFYTTKPEGTGLGMAAVLGIVRGHNGAMSVTSKEGYGTSIRVLLPAHPLALTKPDVTIPAVEVEYETGGMILVVDDEPAVRAVAQKILERAAFDVVTADTGKKAVEALGEHGDTVCAVVLDMKMPDMNGEQVMEQLRTIRPNLPILLSSGYSEVEMAERTEGKGVSAFLPKPYLATELVSAIRGVLAPSH